MKDPKKVEVGKRLAAINHKKREAKKREEAQNGGVSQYYGMGSLCDPGLAGPIGAGFSHAFGAILAVGVIGGLGYYIYQTKKGEWGEEQPSNPQRNDPLETNKFDMD